MTEPRMLQAEGNPIWFDLATPDPEASKRFYADLLGWEYASVDMGGDHYHLAIADDRNIAGIGRSPSDVQLGERPSVWLTHLYTSDARATADRAVANGGAIVLPPLDVVVPGQDGIVGVRCTLTNPAGAVFSLWQSGIGQGAEVFGEPGTMCWVEYHSNDVAFSMNWHRTVFGLEFEAMEVADSDDPGKVSTLHMLKSAGQETSCAFIEVPPHEMITKTTKWLPYAMVDDVAASTRRAIDLGAEAPFGVRSVAFGSYATIIDPQGAILGLWQDAG